MKKAILASLAVIAIAIPTAASTARGDATPQATCTPLKQIYSEKNWRDQKPADGRRSCSVERRAGAKNTVRHFYDYRSYRRITPYRCHSGREGTYAIPCGIIECESHFSWMAANPSGAVGVYQLLGWGAPYPARTFRQRLENHRIAAGLSLSAWVCA